MVGPAILWRSDHLDVFPVSERRIYNRVPGPFEGRCHDGASYYDARITDISLSGCFVDLLLQLRIGDRVTVDVSLHDRPFRLNGEVVYLDKVQGFAVRFVENELPTIEALAEALDRAGRA